MPVMRTRLTTPLGKLPMERPQIIILFQPCRLVPVPKLRRPMQTLYQTIPVARGWFYMPFPIGALMSLFQIVNVGYKRIKAAENAEPEAAAPAAEI